MTSVAGSLIYRLRGVDPDGDSLTFGVRDQPGSDVIRLENFGLNEANIYLNKLLDREVSLWFYITFIYLSLIVLKWLIITLKQKKREKKYSNNNFNCVERKKFFLNNPSRFLSPSLYIFFENYSNEISIE